jgi:hypothetical protein
MVYGNCGKVHVRVHLLQQWQLMWEADMSDPKLCLHIGKFWLYILVLNFASLAMNGYFLHHVELLVQCTH